MTGVPASPSGCEASPSAADASSQSRIPNADELAARWATREFQREMAVERFLSRTGHMMRMARLYRGYTIEELAAKSQVSPQYIRQLERGEIRNASLCSLALMAFALGFELRLEGSAIEARSDATPQSDAAEGESAVGEAETPNPSLAKAQGHD